MKNTFQIFKTDNKSFHWTTNNILLGLFLLFGFIYILNAGIISTIAQKGMIVVFFILFIMSFVNLTRYKHLNGLLDGNIAFKSNSIAINEREIYNDDIQKIFIRANDYYGKSSGMSFRPSLFPTLSQGTNNLLDLDLRNGEKIKVFFRMEYENQLQEIQPFIISLIKNNLITKEKAIELLRIDNDYTLDNFTEELNKKELD